MRVSGLTQCADVYPLAEVLSFIVLIIIGPEEVHQINTSILSWLEMNSGFSQDRYTCITALRLIVDIRATTTLFQNQSGG